MANALLVAVVVQSLANALGKGQFVVDNKLPPFTSAKYVFVSPSLDDQVYYQVKGSRICHPNICPFGIEEEEIFLSLFSFFWLV